MRSDGGAPGDPASVVVHAFRQAMRDPMRGGGHSNQTPSPQAAIFINHTHHAHSSVKCVTLVVKAWQGEPYHPCHCVAQLGVQPSSVLGCRIAQ